MKVSPLNEKIRDFIRKHPAYKTGHYQDLASKFNVSLEVARHQARAVRQEQENKEPVQTSTLEFVPELPEEIVPFNVDEEVFLRKENAQIKSLKRQLESVIKDYDRLNNMYDIAMALRAQEFNKKAPKIEINEKIDNEATAMISISDGHFGKVILSNTINGLNEFNPDIARKRMKNLAENTIKLLRTQRTSVKIDNLYLDLGGDFLDNNQLHPHQEMSTPMSPFEETLFGRELLSGYIRTIAEYGNFKNILISCVVGNHPRISYKMAPGLNHRLSHEYLMYQILKTDFNDSLFTWHIPESDVSEVDIYGNMIRSFHGHQIRSMGGVGGLTIPLNKFILRMDQINPAFYNLCHHFHSLSNATKNCMINGAVCGYDAYAFSLGCEYEPPKQSFILLDRERGITIKTPIFCD